MTRPPASLRYNNPGAQYPGPSARRFGSVGTETIGGGHKIAVFDDPVNGAAAQFDLLLRSYAGLPSSPALPSSVRKPIDMTRLAALAAERRKLGV